MHVVLAIVLFYGVQWQRRAPEAISVDLVRSVPAQAAPEPPPPPKPVAQPEPPKPVDKPPPVKPDIALKEPKPVKKPEPKPEPKVEPKPEPKPEPKKAPPAASAPQAKVPDNTDRLAAMLNQAAADARIDALAKADAARAAAAHSGGGSPGAQKTWEGQIQNAIRPNIVRPGGVTGRPKPEFMIQLWPTGEIRDLKLLTSSGVTIVDESVERAIRKTARLPLPADSRVFQSQIKLVFDPYDPNY